MGVCEVRDITKLTEDNGKSFDYYVLRSVYDKTKVSYIPVENHQVVLRDLISKEDAENEYDKMLKEYHKTCEHGSIDGPDPLLVGEVAYVLCRKPEDLFPADDGENNGQ